MQRIGLAPGTSNPVGGLQVLPFGERATMLTLRSPRLVYAAESRHTNFWQLRSYGGRCSPGRRRPCQFECTTNKHQISRRMVNGSPSLRHAQVRKKSGLQMPTDSVLDK